jgi:hypothetical protein
MDVSNTSYYIFNEKGNKGSQMGHTKKYLTKYSKIKKGNFCLIEIDWAILINNQNYMYHDHNH